MQHSLYVLVAVSLLAFSPAAKAVDAAVCASDAAAGDIKRVLTRGGREVFEVSDARPNPFNETVTAARKRASDNGVRLNEAAVKSVEGQCSASIFTNQGDFDVMYDFVVRNGTTYITVRVLNSEDKLNGKSLRVFAGEKPAG